MEYSNEIIAAPLHLQVLNVPLDVPLTHLENQTTKEDPSFHNPVQGPVFQNFNSFFDDAGDNFFSKLWKNGKKPLEKNEILLEGKLLKTAKKAYAYKCRRIKLTAKKLCYFSRDNEKIPRGEFNIKNALCEFYLTQSQTLKYGIRFIKNAKFFDFFCTNIDEYNKWKKVLSPLCIQTDFKTKYTPLELIGKGTFGKVYKANRNSDSHKFAVKAFSKEFVNAQPNGKTALLNEINILRSLNHKNIIKLEEVHENQNSVYLVMELTNGGDLYQKINTKHFHNHEIQTITHQILSGVAYLSSEKIIHRDLKPENIVFKKRSNICELKIVDFGFATLESTKEPIFLKCGTPGYIAPETFSQLFVEYQNTSTKADVFSCGAIFFLLLTGKELFGGNSAKEILKKNKLCEFDFSSLLLAEQSLELDLLRQMLEKDPKNRISAEMALKHPYFANEKIQYDCETLSQDKNNSINSNNFFIHDNTIQQTKNLCASLVIPCKTNSQSSITDDNVSNDEADHMTGVNKKFSIKNKRSSLPQVCSKKLMLVPIEQNKSKKWKPRENFKTLNSETAKHYKIAINHAPPEFSNPKEPSQDQSSTNLNDPIKIGQLKKSTSWKIKKINHQIAGPQKLQLKASSFKVPKDNVSSKQTNMMDKTQNLEQNQAANF